MCNYVAGMDIKLLSQFSCLLWFISNLTLRRQTKNHLYTFDKLPIGHLSCVMVLSKRSGACTALDNTNELATFGDTYADKIKPETEPYTQPRAGLGGWSKGFT